jgi:HK97 gp10 family phage protein
MIEIKLTGFDQVRQEIKQLRLADRRAALARGALKAVEPFRQEAGRLAPVDTGRLRESIIAQEDKRAGDVERVVIDVGPTSKAFYGLFQEWGTAFAPAQPFMDPALSATIDKINDGLIVAIQSEINKALADG